MGLEADHKAFQAALNQLACPYCKATIDNGLVVGEASVFTIFGLRPVIVVRCATDTYGEAITVTDLIERGRALTSPDRPKVLTPIDDDECVVVHNLLRDDADPSLWWSAILGRAA